MSLVKTLMKKPLVAAVAVIFIAIAAVFIVSLPAATIIVNETELNRAYENNGGLILREITVSPGDKFDVKLFAFASAGMQWSGGVGDIPIVKLNHPRGYSDGSPIPISFGGPGMEKWTFKALEPGETTIMMTYGSVGLTGPPVANTLKLKVTVR